MPTRNLILVLVVTCVTVIGAAAWWSSGRMAGSVANAQALLPDDPATVALGQQIYTDNCASCHGVNLEGQTADWRSPGPDGKLPAPPHDETGHTWHHPDALLFQITKVGLAKAAKLKDFESAMPTYEGVLSDAEIIAVLSFIKSTWPAEVQARHDRINNQKQTKE